MNIEQIAQEVALAMSAEAKWIRFANRDEWAEYHTEFLRRCLSKLAEQAIEPTGYWYSDDPEVCAYPGSGYFPGEVPPNDAINIIPLFTEASLAAAQQKAAEACAKVCNSRAAQQASETREDEADKCADLICNGDWREYL